MWPCSSRSEPNREQRDNNIAQSVWPCDILRPRAPNLDTLAEEQLKTEVNGVILRMIFHANVFSTFCWDYIDILEETLSGRGTTHCINGIVPMP